VGRSEARFDLAQNRPPARRSARISEHFRQQARALRQEHAVLPYVVKGQAAAPTAANPRIARKAQRNEPIAQAIDGIAEEAGGLAGDLERERPFGLVAAAPVYALAFTGPCACFFI